MDDPRNPTVVYGVEAAARYFHVTPRTIQKWVKRGMPKSGKRYDLVACTVWREKYLFGGDSGERPPIESSSKNEKKPRNKKYWGIRHERARALQRKAAYEKRASELMEISEIRHAWNLRKTVVAQGIMALVRSLPPRLQGYTHEREMEAVIRDQVRKLLQFLATPSPDLEKESEGLAPEAEPQIGFEKEFWETEGRRWQALHRESDLKVERGELIEISKFIQFSISRIMAFKQGLLSWARSLPPLLVHQTEENMLATIMNKGNRLLAEFCREEFFEWLTPQVESHLESTNEREVGHD